jgi:hypothetical protein
MEEGRELLKRIGYDNDSITSTEEWVAKEIYKLAKEDAMIHEIFEKANELALDGHGDQAVQLHRIHNTLKAHQKNGWKTNFYCASNEIPKFGITEKCDEQCEDCKKANRE